MAEQVTIEKKLALLLRTVPNSRKSLELFILLDMVEC